MKEKIFVFLFQTGFTLFRVLFWVGLWSFGLGLLLWYPMRWWPGDSFLPVQILNYLMPWLLLSLVPCLLVAIVARRFWLVTVLALPTLLIVLNYAPLFLPRSRVALADTDSPHLKIMSYNIWRRNQDLPSAIAQIEQEKPNLLLLQEVTAATAQRIKDEWAYQDSSTALYLVYDRSMQQAIISRYPLAPLDNSFSEGRVQKVIAYTPGGPVQIWNVHTSQPILWYQHYRQMKKLGDSISAVKEPLIVGGDFNTTDQSEVYHFISRHLKNAHWEAGWGFGFSFPADAPTVKGVPVPTPVVRIDHIFHTNHFFTHNARTLSASGGSDHFPVVAELSLVRE